MTRQSVLVLLLLPCLGAVVGGLACGKYGRPERIQQRAASPVEADRAAVEAEAEQDRDEAAKGRKP